MEVAAAQRRCREGEVEPLRGQPAARLPRLELGLPRLERLSDPADQLVEGLPQLAPDRGIRERPEPAQPGAEQAVATAEVAAPLRLQGSQVRGRGDVLEGLPCETVQVLAGAGGGAVSGTRGDAGRVGGAHPAVSAPLATSTIWVKAAGSDTASSASILRLTVTPALVSPCISWL